MRQPPGGAIVYFVQSGDGGDIKIGFTTSWARVRIATLQTGNPKPLHLLAWIPGGKGTEAKMHEQFAHLRGGGEWFKPAPDLLQFIDDVKRGIKRAKAIAYERQLPPPVPPSTPEDEARVRAGADALLAAMMGPPPATMPARRRPLK